MKQPGNDNKNHSTYDDYLAATAARREAELQPPKQHEWPIVRKDANGNPVYRDQP